MKKSQELGQQAEGKSASGITSHKARLTPEQLLQEIEHAIQDLKRVEQGELQPRQAEELLKAGFRTP